MRRGCNEVDKHVGGKILSLRLANGWSRTQLADKIDVTQQQVEKYEKGTNRISVSRLIVIAKALSQDTSYFYEGLEAADSEPVVTQHQRMCIEVSRNFMRIENSEHQAAVNTLIKSLARDSRSMLQG
jgi:transcriptional regulator with XRE-family HTH domain